jgi:SAM-dependent methyltransferase
VGRIPLAWHRNGVFAARGAEFQLLMSCSVNWQLRCVIDNAKGILPGEQRLRQLKQRIFGFQPEPQKVGWTIEQGLKQVRWLQSALDLPSSCILEIGSGWQPIVPLLLSVAGARQVIMTDLNRLCHPASFAATIEGLKAHKQRIVEQLGISGSAFARLDLPQRHEPLETSLEKLSIQYRAPWDARRPNLPAGSVDAVISRAVLEHVPPPVIAGIFSGVARTLRPGGVMCHIIDNSDHWEHADKSISRVNFLKYSDAAFRVTHLNGLSYQNRLRHSEYAGFLSSAGFVIEREEREIDPKSCGALETLQVAPRFRGFSRDDLATITSYFMARKPVTA